MNNNKKYNYENNYNSDTDAISSSENKMSIYTINRNNKVRLQDEQ